MAARSRAVLTVVGAAGAGLSACTLLVGVPSGLTGGAPGEAGAEGSVPDAARADTARDAPPAGDTGGGTETGMSDVANDAAPYPAGSWCAMQPQQDLVLCDDFDHDTLAFSRWTTQDFGVQGSAGFSSTNVSPPSSLQIDVPPHTSSTFFLEVLEKDVPRSSTATRVLIDFHFQPMSWPDAGNGDQIYIASLAQGPGSPRVAVAVFTGPAGTELQEQDTDATGMDTFNTASAGYVPPAGNFTNFRLVVTFGSPSMASLMVGNTTIATLPLKGDWQSGMDTAAFLGDWYVTTTPGFDLLYDNVTIRQQ